MTVFTHSAFLQSDDAKRKMFNNTSGKDFQAKQEFEGDSNENILPIPKYTSTSRQWAGFKNPRIVRVSKAFGGKDRHSKVYTVKGLRDRRIRLSVPTAIQLYDLQDRLGLSQPSKVIDWLLDSTKDDIDQLPPLQMLVGDFNQFYPTSASASTALIPQDLNSPQVSLSQSLRTIPNETFVKNHDINEDHQRNKGKEALVENKPYQHENGGLNFFPIPQYSYNPGVFPYNPYSNWEPCANLSISQFGNQGLVSSQTDHSAMALPSASQLLLGPPTAITPSAFPPFIMPNLGENHDLVRQNNYFHLLSSSSQHVPSNSLMTLFNPE